MVGGLAGLLSRYIVLLSGLPLGCLLLIKVGGLSPLRNRGFGRFMMIVCSSCLGRMLFFFNESLDAGDVSQAWLVGSGAAETALADAYRFSGGPAPNRGLVLGRGRARFRVVRFGGHKVRKVRGSVADAHDAAVVFFYRCAPA